jgi:mRNA interferase MazF
MYGKTTINRRDIWAVDLDPAQGSEMDKIRPCLVVTNNIANQYAQVITVVALTTTPPTKPYPFIVEVPDSAKMPEESWIDCAHIRAVDKSRLRRYYTSLDSDTMSKVDAALRVQLSLDHKRTGA